MENVAYCVENLCTPEGVVNVARCSELDTYLNGLSAALEKDLKPEEIGRISHGLEYAAGLPIAMEPILLTLKKSATDDPARFEAGLRQLSEIAGFLRGTANLIKVT